MVFLTLLLFLKSYLIYDFLATLHQVSWKFIAVYSVLIPTSYSITYSNSLCGAERRIFTRWWCWFRNVVGISNKDKALDLNLFLSFIRRQSRIMAGSGEQVNYTVEFEFELPLDFLQNWNFTELAIAYLNFFLVGF